MATVVHAGFPKTGSTLLQDHVFPFIEGYDYDKSAQGVYRVLADHYLPDIDPGSPVFRMLDPGDRIISAESFLHYTVPLAWRKYGRRPRADIFVANISQLFREQGRLLIVLRRQDSAINSWLRYAPLRFFGDKYFFLDYPMRGRGWPVVGDGINAYKRQCLDNVYGGMLACSFDYHDILKRLSLAVDKSRIHLLLYEELLQDKGAFLGRLERVFDQDLQRLMPNLQQVVNKSPDSPPCPHPRFVRGLDNNRSLKTRLFSLIGRLTAHPAALSEGFRSEIMELYREGNRAIARDFDLPLEQYGYC